jgi:hyperosmotically inducible periplasmic protein
MRTKNKMSAVVIAAAIALTWNGGLRAADTDDRIETAAKNSYVFQTYLKNDDIKVESKDGVVTLTGTVANESHKSLAEDTVKALPGVTSVQDQLQTKAQAASDKSDDWIGAKVKLALLFHRSVSATTEVNVKDGVVTLNGTASSQAEKDLTTLYAKDVEGVKRVVNKMTVSPDAKSEPTLGKQVDDASITAQVKVALLTTRSTSAIRTEVETENGVVTLRGTAKNQAEIDLATKLVKDVNGVKDVKNQMTIQG